MKRFILSCCISLLALFHAFGSENNFPLELQGAISCIDNSDLISKVIPVAEQEIRADYVMLDNDALSKVYYNILYWNTATGESHLYHFVDSASKFVLFREEMQLPTEPLGFNATGKVMADYEAVYNTKNNKAYYEILFWDTKTGKSKLYFFDDMTQNFKAYSSNVQLPSIPLFRTQGEVMAKYSAIYMSAQDKTIYEVLFWDTATGKSKLYHYDYAQKKFVPYDEGIQLPNNPLNKPVQGKVMADYKAVYIASQDKAYYEALFWDTKTGYSRMYHYSKSQKKFVLYKSNIQFPENPLNTSATGDVMADYQALYNPASNVTYYEAVFWDTKTGKSKFYKYSNDKKTFVLYEEKIQLPLPDIVDNQNDIYLNYQAEFITNRKSSMYEVLFFNVRTGKSRLYYFKGGDAGRFIRYKDDTLPLKPLD